MRTVAAAASSRGLRSRSRQLRPCSAPSQASPTAGGAQVTSAPDAGQPPAAAARRAAQAGTPATLVFDLSEHWAGLSLNGAVPAGIYRVELSKALRVTELWFGEKEEFSGRVIFRASSQGVLPTYVVLAGPRDATIHQPARWWVRAGGSGQRVEVADRYAAREVLDALR